MIIVNYSRSVGGSLQCFHWRQVISFPLVVAVSGQCWLHGAALHYSGSQNVSLGLPESYSLHPFPSSLLALYHSCATSVSGISSLSSAVCHSSSSSFYGKSIQISSLKRTQIALKSPASRPVIMMIKPVIQFIQGTDEQTVPDVSLTRSRDGTNGVATFTFEEPSVFDSSSELGDITGFYMIDEEGVLQSTNVSAKFVNGKPSTIEAKYTMRSPREWDRFMRFMERYSNANGLQFVKK